MIHPSSDELLTENVLPTEIDGYRDTEISPGVWLITNPRFQPCLEKWTALANVGGILCLIELRVKINSPTIEVH